MTVSGTTIVALDFDSDLHTSDDNGSSFTLRETTTETYRDLTSVASTVVTVGVDGLILRSADGGLNWSEATVPVPFGSFYGVAGRTDGTNPNKWIAVGEDGLDGSIYRSPDDGVNWTSVETLPNSFLESAIWTGNRWVVCGSDDSFEGVVYTSTDGTNWTASTVPAGANALLDLAANGSGTVLAVGEGGQILRSTDDGLTFSAIAPKYLGGGDLNAVVADGSGTFVIGGDEKMIIEVDGTLATTLVPATPTASSVRDLIIVDGSLTAVGSFAQASTRTEPLTVTIAPGGSLDYVLTAGPTLFGKSYFVQTTTDLIASDWTLVSGTETAGNGTDLTFEVSEDSSHRFWRVVEF